MNFSMLWLTRRHPFKIDGVSAGDSEVLWKSYRPVDASRKRFDLCKKTLKKGVLLAFNDFNTPSSYVPE